MGVVANDSITTNSSSRRNEAGYAPGCSNVSRHR